MERNGHDLMSILGMSSCCTYIVFSVELLAHSPAQQSVDERSSLKVIRPVEVAA